MKMYIMLLSFLLIPCLVSAGTMRDGLWELTTTMEMPGMPMKMPPQVIRHCYSKEDVKDQKKMIARDNDCKVTDYKQSGSMVTWKMKCTGKSAGDFSGETTFSGDSYTSNMKMSSQGQKMSMKIIGRRIGNCP